jgi:hypothetical protein
LLRNISSAIAEKKALTYSDAARIMGRPQNHARAIAQMCDLLDAAACLAGVPLLALVAVREKSGKINPRAWRREYEPLRDAIIQRSLDYQFGPADFKAIGSALKNLGQRGNKTAWEYVKSLYPGDLLYRRLTGNYEDTKSNAIDDLGTYTPRRARLEVWSYPRDPKVRDEVMRRAKDRCEFCGKLGFMKSDRTRYLESHHVIALAEDGEDRVTNVIALCPNDHRQAHFGERRENIEKEMIRKLKAML